MPQNLAAPARAFLLLMVVLAGQPVHAAMHTVTTLPDSVDGSLRLVLQAAGAGDTVEFALPDNDTVRLADSILIDRDVVLLGGINRATGNRMVVCVDSPGVSTYRVFSITAAVTIKGLVMLGGATGSVEGGVLKATGKNTVLVLDSVVASGGNCTGSGGGIYAGCARFSLVNSEVSGNACRSENSARGGGLYCTGSSVVLENCRIHGNSVKSEKSSANGGGMYSTFSKTVIHRCRIDSNLAHAVKSTSLGGGICNLDTMQITGCIIEGNEVRAGGTGTVAVGPKSCGGGVFNSRVLSMSCTDGRSGWGDGGGIGNGGLATVDRCRIALNASYGSSLQDSYGGTGTGGGAGNKGILNLIRTVVDSNRSSGGGGNSYGGKAFGGGIYNLKKMFMAFSTIAGNTSIGKNGDTFSGNSEADDFYDSLLSG